MSLRSRRKTLCHTEIESFLNEISTDDMNQKSRKRRTTLLSSGCDSENYNTNIIKDEDFGIISKSIDISVKNSDDISMIPYLNQSKENVKIKSLLKEETDKELIREYCRLTLQQCQGGKDGKVNMAKKIVERTTYKIMPARFLYPEMFEHPASSIDGKKSLLLSLTSSLDEAEKQRKIDTTATEEFTRCRVQKSRGKSSFEYRDIDIDVVIPEEEYEKRYLLHLKSLRKDSIETSMDHIHFQSSHHGIINKDNEKNDDIIATTSIVIKSDSQQENRNTVTYEDDFSFDFLDSSYHPREKSIKSRDRRVTLSPTSARKMIGTTEKRRQSIELLPLLDIEESLISDSLPTNIDDFTKVNVVDHDSHDDIVLIPKIRLDEDKAVNDFKDELDALLADSDENEEDKVEEKEEVRLSFSKDDKNDPEIDSTSNTDISITTSSITTTNNNNNNSSETPTSDSIISTELNMIVSNEQISPALHEDFLRVAQEKAYSRMRIRMEQSWWKYQWELVSSHAVLSAKMNCDKKE